LSYDICLKDPVTNKTIEINEPHFMRGGIYQIGGSKELWLNITYNYSHYYYEATDGDPRFAHKEERNGEFENEYGIRGIYGKTGLESIPMLEDMILRITDRYQADGEWISTKRTVSKYYDEDGNSITREEYERLYLTETVKDKNGEVLFTYTNRNESVYEIRWGVVPYEEGEDIPITVYHYQELRHEDVIIRDLINPIFVIIYLSEIITAILLYFRRKENVKNR
jgi:hypothetical protein